MRTRIDELGAASCNECNEHEAGAIHGVTATGMKELSVRCDVTATATPVAAPAATTPTMVQSHHFL